MTFTSFDMIIHYRLHVHLTVGHRYAINTISFRFDMNTFQVAFCATFGMIGNPELDYMSWALNWGVAYDLPNQTWIIEQRHHKITTKPVAQRRHRRDLYNRLEAVIDK